MRTRPQTFWIALAVWCLGVVWHHSALAQNEDTPNFIERITDRIERTFFHKPFAFALIGDQPYSNSQEAVLDNTLKQITENNEVDWIMHVGDIKGGGELCTDGLLNRRLNQLRKSAKPLVFTPGDNEWTDCHRESNGSFNSQERLAFLRKQVFSKPESLGKNPIKVKQQTELGFPEHLMWRQGSTLMITLNVPGSNNDLNNPGSRGLHDEQVQKLFVTREAAIDAWLSEAEKQFLTDSPPTEVIVAFQGNPIDGSGRAWSLDRLWKTGDGYESLLKRLIKLVDNTRRPLLIAHGDTHRFKWDTPDLKRFGAKPETQAMIRRVECWGHPFTGSWVKVTVSPGQTEPFRVESVPLH